VTPSSPATVASKKKSGKSAFDPSIIPDDVAANTMSIDHGYFLSFLPQQKGKL
jgi:hypothetical protein